MAACGGKVRPCGGRLRQRQGPPLLHCRHQLQTEMVRHSSVHGTFKRLRKKVTELLELATVQTQNRAGGKLCKRYVLYSPALQRSPWTKDATPAHQCNDAHTQSARNSLQRWTLRADPPHRRRRTHFSLANARCSAARALSWPTGVRQQQARAAAGRGARRRGRAPPGPAARVRSGNPPARAKKRYMLARSLYAAMNASRSAAHLPSLKAHAQVRARCGPTPPATARR